ncbi:MULTISPECIES: M48 family metalloprotease [Streptomyces]|uniref:M48 family metallopeptidase n=1 Tax=Streptomyces doudnae TaxID=3075536 RepID=A0ABD5EGW2_9ACTN|nr:MULTISPECIES: M48 family metallopeptidase [unclassified Streptomyces]MDT0433624.1 M48 family metallopeptidase [Streptomyces sp. DSM 41981]MYQ64083.1 M48 family metalloprotease [Streptomyces sp. SID4950]SCD71379.1 Zn-dependent protease with chaperone function [Streptomyces sp. SolWspMP-5a-2]
MGAILRALRAVVLLCGFPLLSLLLLALLAGADVLALTRLAGLAALKIVIVSFLLAVPVVQGVLMLRVPRAERPDGVTVTEADEPRLWALVRELADATGTRAPDEIVLTGEVNAAVGERPRLLGLLPGPRALHLGVPLLTGLSEAQLRSVLAHEYGHFTGGDTRLSALVVRGRVQLAVVIDRFTSRADDKVAAERARQERAAAKRLTRGRRPREVDTRGVGLTYRAMAALYTAYAKLYLRASLSTARAQEYAADLTAARITGRDTTASALRALPALTAAHDFYLARYASLGVPVRLLPPRGEFLGGFARMLAAREENLAELRTALPAAPASPYDSHPPIAERVRRVEQLPSDGAPVAAVVRVVNGLTGEAPATGAALDLLTDPARTLAALEDVILTDDARSFRRAADWQDLLDTAMSAHLTGADTPLRQALAAYTRRPPTLNDLLTLIDDGALWQLAHRLPLSEQAIASKGRAFREFARPVLRTSLRTMVLAEFSARSLLHWEFSWAHPATVRLPGAAARDAASTDAPDNTRDTDARPGPDSEEVFEAALDAALADHPDTAPLRALLPPSPHPAEQAS